MSDRIYERDITYLCDIEGELYEFTSHNDRYFEVSTWESRAEDEHFSLIFVQDEDGNWVLDPVEHPDGIEGEKGKPWGDPDAVMDFIDKYGPPPREGEVSRIIRKCASVLSFYHMIGEDGQGAIKTLFALAEKIEDV